MELPIKSENRHDADRRRLVPLQNIHCSLAYIENMASRSRRRGNRLTASTESPSCSARGYRWPRRDLTNVHGRTPYMDRTRMSDTPGLGKSPPVKGTGPRRPDMDVTSTGPGHAFGKASSAIRGKKRRADFACATAAQDGEAGSFFMEPPGVGWRTSKKKPPAWSIMLKVWLIG